MRFGWTLWLALGVNLAQQPAQQATQPPETATPIPAPEGARPTLLEYTGKPLRVPYECTEDDMQSFGMICTNQDPCEVYLELAAVESVGAKIFLSGNLHTSSTTLYSILLASDDNGKTWTEPHERIRTAGLDLIQFLDFETGWIAGQTLQAFPRDPFFLVTTDGGKTWRSRLVFGESRIGSIDQFWFDSRTAGTLVVVSGGRREQYESMTGGESWMLRQVSEKPILLKRGRTPNADWRVRADGLVHAHRIEKRTQEKWQTVSSFLVTAAQCQPAERVLTPPPEPTPEPDGAQTATPVAPAPTKPKQAPTLKKKPNP